MDLATYDFSRFIGGQLEVQNTHEGYLYRGEIADVVVQKGEAINGVGANDLIKFTLAWMAKMEDGEWINDDRLEYSISTLIYSGSEIGDSRVLLRGWPPYNYEVTALFPKGGSRLDPARVRGLELAA